MHIQITPAHLVQQIIMLASGSPGSEQDRAALLELYESSGDWSEVGVAFDDYMNSLLGVNGNTIETLYQKMASNALGVNLSLTEVQHVITWLSSIGIDTWSKLFTYMSTELTGELAEVFNNRADAANKFTDLMVSLNKDADYGGSQALAAANEWLRGIGASEESHQVAVAAADELIARFTGGDVQGTVMDGYVAGATVFIDVDGDGQFDVDEPSTLTDANGNFVFVGDLPPGTLIATGGIDLATSLPFTGTLYAPAGSVVLTPLTNLTQQMLADNPVRTVENIETQLFSVFDLSAVDLSTYDPIKSGLDPAADHAQKLLAVQIQAVTSQVINVLNVATAFLNNLLPGNAANKLASMTALIATLNDAAAANSTVDLANADTLTTLFMKAAVAAGVIDDESTAAEIAAVEALAGQASQSLEGINALTQEAVNTFAANAEGNIVDAMSDVFRLQILTQTRLVSEIEANTSGDFSEIIAEYSGESLVENTSELECGNLDAETPISKGTVTDVPEVVVPPPPPPPPSAPIIALADDTGSSASDRITSNGLVHVSGLEAGASWEYFVTGASAWTSGSGTSFTISGDGVKTILVQQTTDSGTSSQATLSIRLDTSVLAPVITLASDTGSSASDGITTNGTVNVSGLEGGSAWEYNVNGASFWTGGIGTSFTLSGDGEKTVLVRQTDAAGNASTNSVALNFTLAGELPPTPVLALAEDTGSSANDGITSNGTVNVSGLQAGATWEYNVNGAGTWTSGTGSSFTLSGDGAKTILVRQTTLGGSTSADAALNFTLDTTVTAPPPPPPPPPPLPSAPGLALAADTGSSASDGITSNGTVNVSGVEAGATWEYNVDGTWSSGSGTNFTLSGDGAKTVMVRQTTSNGTSAETTLNVTLDTTVSAPTATLNSDTGTNNSDGITNDGTVNISGLEAGANWEYNINGAGTWTSGSGTSFVLSGDGEKTVLVRQTDAAGNVSADSVALSFTLDTTVSAPVASLASDTGTSDSDGITSNGTVNVSGIETDATWEYNVNGESTWSSGSGSSFTLSGDGEKTVLVRQTDKTGNTSATGTLNFTLEDGLPATPILALADDTGTSDSDGITSNGVVNVSSLESGATWEYNINGAGTWTSGTGSSITLSDEGEHTILVRQTSLGGFTSAEATLSVTIDTTISTPVATLANDTGTSNSDGITSDGTVNVSGIETGATWEYNVNGDSSWIAGTGTSFTLSGDGEKTVLVRQTDTAGNASADSVALTFTLEDGLPPSPVVTLAEDTGTSDSDGITSNGTVNVSGLEAGATWEYNVHGAGTWTSGSGSSLTLSGDGEQTILVRQTTLGGVTSANTTLNVILDTTVNAPAATLANDTGTSDSDGITTDGTVNVSGIETGATWEYNVNGAGTWTAGTGTSFTLSGDGEKTVLVRQTDAAGNASADSAALTFTLEDGLPPSPVVTLADDTGTSDSDGITSNGSVNVSGLEAGATWEYNVNGAGTWTAGTGSSFILSGEGEQTVLVRQTTLAGGTSPEATLNVTLDTIANAPVATLANDTGSSDSDGITSDGTVNVSGIETDATWEYNVNGAATWIAGTGSSFVLGGDGEKTVLVRQTDAAGNASANSVALTFTLEDGLPPSPVITLADDTGTSDSDGITSNGTVNVSGLETDATWEYNVNGAGTWTAGTGTSFILSGDGEKTILVRQTTLGGGTSPEATLNVTLDTAVSTPVATLASDTGSSDSDGITNNGTVNVSGLETGATWEYNVNGDSSWIAGTGSGFVLSGNGEKTVLVRQTDTAGNASAESAALTFTLQVTTPASPVVTLATDTGASSTDGITSNGLVNVSGLDTGATWEYSIDAGGSWTVGSGGTLTLTGTGPRNLIVRQIDGAGNMSDTTALAVTLYTPAPTLATLNGSNGVRFDGEIAGDMAGTSVSGVGDINGDGYDDVIVSAPFANPDGDAHLGSTYVVFGTAAGFGATLALASLDGSTGFRIDSENVNGGSGVSDVRGAGDVNGDGYADLIIGSRFSDPNGGTSGSSYVVFGKAGGYTPVLSLTSLDGSNGFRLDGGATDDNSGWVASSAGDINGDGFAEVIVGAFGADPNGVSTAGASYVVFGKSGGFSSTLNLSTLAEADGFRLDGTLPNDSSGVSVSVVGDINGDGYDDLIIGARRTDFAGESSGSAYVVFGKAGGFGTIMELGSLDGTDGFRVDGVGSGDFVGFSASGAGDVNGDGYADVIIGAFGTNSSIGAAHVVFGKAGGFDAVTTVTALDGSNGFQINGVASLDQAGFSVSGAGDVNGDGFDDLLISANMADPNGTSSGAAYVVFGKSGGFTAAVDLASLDSNSGFRLDGLAAGDETGTSVRAAGDVNGDGYADLIVGAPMADPLAAVDAGSAYLVFGASFTGAVTFTGTSGADTLTGTAAAERFVSGAGNDIITGGGGADVIHAGAGNDTLTFASLDFQLADGGSGVDTLALAGGGMNLNLASVRGRISSIEIIDLTGSGDNVLTLNALDVLNLSDNSNVVKVNGDTGDSVVGLSSGWTAGAEVEAGYLTFQQGEAIVLVGVAVTTDFPAG